MENMQIEKSIVKAAEHIKAWTEGELNKATEQFNAQLKDAIGSINVTNGVDGKDGKDGTFIKAFELSDDGSLTIVMSDDSIAELGSIKGADGKDGANGKDGVDGKSVAIEDVEQIIKAHIDMHVEGSLMPRSDSQIKALTVSTEKYVSELNEALNAYQKALKDGLEQYQAEIDLKDKEFTDSIKGEIGLLKETVDGVVAEALFVKDKAAEVIEDLDKAVERFGRAKVVAYEPDTTFKSGSFVQHKGRLYVANRDTDSDPTNSSGYTMLLRGPEFRKAWSAEAVYERLDVVISSTGSAWIAAKDAPMGEPGSTPDWHLMVKRGERGAKGDIGPQGEKGLDGLNGKDGDSVKAVAAGDQGFLVEFASGRIDHVEYDFNKAFDGVLKAAEEQYNLPINSFEGVWQSGTSYKKGSVVSYANAFYLARKNTDSNIAPREIDNRKATQVNDNWKLFILLPDIPVVKGDKGDQGDPGATTVIRGSFGRQTTVEDLPVDGLVPKDLDGVGYPKADYQMEVGDSVIYLPADFDDPKYGYLYTFVDTASPTGWIEVGKVSGPMGPTGPQGDPGIAEGTIEALEARIAALEARLAADLAITGNITATGDITAFSGS
jgi:hypothetical protein